MKNATPPLLTPEEIKSRRESRHTWFGCLADDNIEHILTRFRRLLGGQYYTVVTNNVSHNFEVPEVKVSQFLTPGRLTDGSEHDGLYHHRIGDKRNWVFDDEKESKSCGINIVDSYGVYGIHSNFATEAEAQDARTSEDMRRVRWVTYLTIEGGHSDDPREVGSRDRIEIIQYNYLAEPQQLHWVFAPERHWDNSGPDQYKEA